MTFRWQREVMEALVDEDVPKLIHALDYPVTAAQSVGLGVPRMERTGAEAAAATGESRPHHAMERVCGGTPCGVPYTLGGMGFYDDSSAAFATPLIGAARRGDTLLHLALRNDLTVAFLALVGVHAGHGSSSHGLGGVGGRSGGARGERLLYTPPCAAYAELVRPLPGGGTLRGDESVPSLPALAAERLARYDLLAARAKANGIHNVAHELRHLVVERAADFEAIRSFYGAAIAEEQRLQLLIIRERMVELFHRFHPTQLEHVDRIWREHEGREAELAMKLERKYGGRGVAFDWDHSPEHHYGENGILLND